MSNRIPPMPKRPTIEDGPKPTSWIGVLLATIVGVAVYVCLTFLTLGVFGPVLIIGGLIFGMAAFHYLVWGWWLSSVLEAAQDDDDHPDEL